MKREEKSCLQEVKKQRYEAFDRQRQSRRVETKNILHRHRQFESDEQVTAQEIVDTYFPRNSVLVQDWGVGGKQFAIALSDDESAVAILTDEEGFVSLNALNDTRHADVIHEEWRTMRDVEKSGWV